MSEVLINYECWGKLSDVLKWNSQLPIRSRKRGGCRRETIQEVDECHLSAEQVKFTGAYECHKVVYKHLCTNNKTFIRRASHQDAACVVLSCMWQSLVEIKHAQNLQYGLENVPNTILQVTY